MSMLTHHNPSYLHERGNHSETRLFFIPDQKKLNLWAGTRQGLSHYSIDRLSLKESDEKITGTFIPHENIRIVFGDLNVRDLFYDSEKQDLWIGTNDKLYQMNPFTISFSGDFKGGFNQDLQISDIYEDSHETIWIGTLAGLYRIGTGVSLFETFGIENPDLGAQNVTAIINLDSSFLSGTLNNGLFETRIRKDGSLEEIQAVINPG